MNRGFKVMAAALGAVLLLGVVAAGAAFAADPPSGSSGTTNYYNVFTSKVASILGIDQKKLTDATTQARNETIDQMVKDGRITADQAKFMKDRAAYMQANGGPMGFGPGGFGGGPRFGGGFDRPWGTPPWAATPTPTTH